MKFGTNDPLGPMSLGFFHHSQLYHVRHADYMYSFNYMSLVICLSGRTIIVFSSVL